MSTIKCTTIQNLSGVEVYTAKAWVNFNGTGTVAIRASGNVSSITDNGTGDYTVNFTNAMPDANYSVQANCQRDVADNNSLVSAAVSGVASPSTTACRIYTRAEAGSGAAIFDSPGVHLAIFR